MSHDSRFVHEFVESVPERLEPGTLYVSMRYATVMHMCACGCENEIVTPLCPTAWKIIYDGETVSLSPSVGNWSYPCRSHYWIEHGRIRWATPWSDRQVEAGRERTLQERGDKLAGDQSVDGWLRRVGRWCLRLRLRRR